MTDCNTTRGFSGPQAHRCEPINYAALFEYHTTCFAHIMYRLIVLRKRSCLPGRVNSKRHPLSVPEGTATWRRVAPRALLQVQLLSL